MKAWAKLGSFTPGAFAMALSFTVFTGLWRNLVDLTWWQSFFLAYLCTFLGASIADRRIKRHSRI